MAHDRKPDFSDVQGSSRSTGRVQPDFSNVVARTRSTEDLTDATGARTYTVAKGDTLSHIARVSYGKASLWPLIFEANRDQLDNPDRIFPGQVLRIPPPAEDGGPR